METFNSIEEKLESGDPQEVLKLIWCCAKREDLTPLTKFMNFTDARVAAKEFKPGTVWIITNKDVKRHKDLLDKKIRKLH